MSVLRRAHIEVLPDTAKFDGTLKAQLQRADPGGKAGKQIGGQLNAALRRLDVAPIDVRADPRQALAGIAVAEARLQELSGQAATVEVKVQTERALGQLGRFRKQLGDVGGDAAPEIATGLSARLGPLLARMPVPPQALAAFGAIGLSAAPIIGAAVSGAIVAGAAAGAAGIGVAIASQDERVQTAAKQVGDTIKSQLLSAAVPFVQTSIAALNQFESRFRGMSGSITEIMRNASSFLEPLVDGVADFMAPVLSGVDALVAKASPVVEALRQGLGEVGLAIGDVFQSLADNGVESGMAISIVFGGIANTVRAVGAVVNWLTETFGFLIKVADKLGFLSDEGKEKLSGLRGATEEMTGSSKAGAAAQGGFKAALEAATTSTGSASTALTGMAAATAVATERTKELKEGSDALFGSQMSLDQSTLKLAEGRVELEKELLKGARTLALDSEEGRNNRSAVLEQIGAIDSLRQSRIKHGLSLDVANRKYIKDIDGLRSTMRQAGFTEDQIGDLVGAYRGIPAKVTTAVSSTGVQAVGKQLIALQAYQNALKNGAPVVSIRKQLSSDNADFLKYAAGGAVRGPGTKTSDSIPALLSNDEHVWTADEVGAVGGHGAMKRMRQAALSGELPGFARGGAVRWPYPVTAAMTKIPSRAEAASKVTPAGPSGGATGPFLERLLEARFGANMISGYRPGSRTLSGNLSYHARNRAVDFPPMQAMARFMYQNYKSQLKEAITPYQQYNVHNGRDKRWTGAVWNQHNFAGGNAHNHFAMANGGVIREPVFGVGASGASYSFGERGQPETVTPGVHQPGGVNTAELAALLRELIAATRGIAPGVGGHVRRAVGGVDAGLGAMAGLYSRTP